MELEKLFQELQKNIQQEEGKSKRITPDFNAFQVLSPKETQLSRFIGELLNPKGKHAQERLFLDLFIDNFLRKRAFFKNAKNVDVSLEYANKSLDGQIDIFIVFENKFAIAIENKPFADDQERQIMRYCDFMARAFGEDNFLMIYLSADGSNPTDKSLSKDERGKLEKENKYLVISYPQIRDWVSNCIKILKKTGAERLTKLLGEFAEYINLEFRKQNELKNTPIHNTLKNNIVQAHQVVSLWNDSYKKFKRLYAEKVNQLFNEELPKLVYEDLKSRGIIDHNWEYKKGNFDIDIKHFKGWLIKKSSWKGSGVGVCSNKLGYGDGTWKGVNEVLIETSDFIKGIKNRNIANYPARGFYPVILSKYLIDRPYYNLDYCTATGCDKTFDEREKIVKGFNNLFEVWWSYFPENKYQFWGDEHWREVKPNGKTVNYISAFLEKVIEACEADIDEVEGVNEKESL